MRLLDAQHGDGVVRVALWWRDSRTLEFVELRDGGIGTVQVATGRGEHSPSLVR